MQASTKEISVKKLRRIQRGTERHWVGDGFPVRTLFDYSNHGVEMSPFLLFDYAGPMTFPPTNERLGVGAHPHRGFETVTIVYVMNTAQEIRQAMADYWSDKMGQLL